MDVLNILVAFGIPAYVVGLLTWRRWKPIVRGWIVTYRRTRRGVPSTAGTITPLLAQRWTQRAAAVPFVEPTGDGESDSSPSDALGDDDEDDDEDEEELELPEIRPPTAEERARPLPVYVGPTAIPASFAETGKVEDWIDRLVMEVIHLMVLGGTGAGKTLFLQELVRRLLNRGWPVIVCDPDAAQGEWAGALIYGAGDNFEAIDRAFASLAKEMEERRRARADRGQRSFPPLWVVVEEFAEVQAECVKAPIVVERALRRARKLNIHILIGVQDSQVKTLGWERKSSLLTNLTQLTIVKQGDRRVAAYNGHSHIIPTLAESTAESPVSGSSPPSVLPENAEFPQVLAEPPAETQEEEPEPEEDPESETDDKDDSIAILLAQRWSYSRIVKVLNVSTARIARVRRERALELGGTL